MLSIVIGVSIIIVNTYIDVNIISNNAKPSIWVKMHSISMIGGKYSIFLSSLKLYLRQNISSIGSR